MTLGFTAQLHDAHSFHDVNLALCIELPLLGLSLIHAIFVFLTALGPSGRLPGLGLSAVNVHRIEKTLPRHLWLHESRNLTEATPSYFPVLRRQ